MIHVFDLRFQHILCCVEVYGHDTVPRGMWHQFGVIEPDKSKGIFLEIDDIPRQWLAHHYQVVNEASPYNDYNPGISSDPQSNGNQLKNKMKSLTNLFGFNATSISSTITL